MTDRQYIVTERAHLMCPNMYFGILISIKENYDWDKINAVKEKLSDAHPFLKCLIAEDENHEPYYQVQSISEVILREMVSLKSMEADYKQIGGCGWDVFSEGLLRIYTYPEKNGFDVLFAAHHLLCDGRGLMELAISFADCYVKGVQPVYQKECLIRSMEDMPNGSDLSLISKMVIDSANRQWKKEGKRVIYKDYLAFEKDFCRKNPLCLYFKSESYERTAEIISMCHDNAISVNDYLIAKMMQEEDTNKVVIAADIRSCLSAFEKGSLGNFATAFSVSGPGKSAELMETAGIVSKNVRRCMADPGKMMTILACYFRMTPELIDAVAISTLGDFKSRAGMFVGSRMFGYRDRSGYSITNLGKYESETIIDAVFIPPASPANRKTVGALTVNGILHTCTVTCA